MKDATFLAWLAVIYVGGQLIAVFVMWQLQRLNNLEILAAQRRDRLTPEERLALVEEEARIAAEATAKASMELVRTAQTAAIRDEIRRVLEEARRD